MSTTLIKHGFKDAKAATRDSIHLDMDFLVETAKGCESIVEFGTRHGLSAYGWLMSNPKRLMCVDIAIFAEFIQLERAAKEAGIEFTIRICNDLTIDLQETDLLFIDSNHTYKHLSALLEKHHVNIRKRIVMHDTKATPPSPLDKACDDFLEIHKEWKKVLNDSHNCTVFERISE